MQMVVDFWVVQIQRVIDVVVVVAVVQVAVVAVVVVQKVVHQQNDVVAVAVAFVVVVEDHPVYEKMLVDENNGGHLNMYGTVPHPVLRAAVLP